MGLNAWEILIILLILLIIFGAGKLPLVMGDLAKGIRSFKAGLKDDGTPSSASDKGGHAAAPGNLPNAGKGPRHDL